MYIYIIIKIYLPAYLYYFLSYNYFFHPLIFDILFDFHIFDFVEYLVIHSALNI